MANDTTAPYEYMDEMTIDPDLLCSICREPCRDPYITLCNHLFCHHCIIRWRPSRDRACPNCRKMLGQNSLRSAPSIICHLINQIKVKCKRCGQQNLSRLDIDDHIKSMCLKSIVSCSSVNIKCSWVGQRDKLDEHLASCMAKCLNTTIIKLNDDCEKIKNDLKQIEQTYSQKGAILKSKVEEINQSTQMASEIKTIDITTVNIKCTQFVSDTESNGIRLNTLQNKVYELMVNTDHVLKEIRQTDEDCIRHDVGIHKCTKRLKSMQEVLFQKHNSIIDDDLAYQESNSSIDMSRRCLIDQDIEIIVQWMATHQQCQELDLRQNFITEAGIPILMNSFNSSSTIQVLHLSNNNIRDTGVFHLANALSIQNSTLLKLDLDSNNITYEGANYLANMLKINQTLKYLSLDENPLGDTGLQSLATVLIDDNKTLKELFLFNRQRSANTTITILIRMIQLNSSLETFGINNSSLTEETKIKLEQVAKHKPHFALRI